MKRRLSAGADPDVACHARFWRGLMGMDMRRYVLWSCLGLGLGFGVSVAGEPSHGDAGRAAVPSCTAADGAVEPKPADADLEAAEAFADYRHEQLIEFACRDASDAECAQAAQRIEADRARYADQEQLAAAATLEQESQAYERALIEAAHASAQPWLMLWAANQQRWHAMRADMKEGTATRLDDKVSAAEQAAREAADATITRTMPQAGGDVLYWWTLAQSCPGTPATCAGTDAWARLHALAPENALVWLTSDASVTGGPVRMAKSVARAAQANYADSYLAERARRIHALLLSLPPPPAGFSREMLAPGVVATEASERAAWALALAMNDYLVAGWGWGTLEPCTDPGLAPLPEALAADCVAVATLLADSATVAERTLGLRLLSRLGVTASDREHSSKRLRAHEWRTQRASQVLGFGAGDSEDLQTYLDVWLAAGEVAAHERLLLRRGIPLEPPPQWQSTHERMRAQAAPAAPVPGGG